MLRIALILLTVATAHAQSPEASDWGHYGGDAFGQRYSSLAEIHRENVGKLAPAWEFRTGELGAGFQRADRLAFQATPILVFGLLYLSTPTNIVIALDPATGSERWRFDPHIDRTRPYAEASSRGVSAWENPNAARGQACARRIFSGTLDARLIALDAWTGRPCIDFGNNGMVNVLADLRIHDPNDYQIISPAVTSGAQVMVSFSIGIVRSYDARSGALRWTYNIGRVRGPMNVDLDRNMLFIPAGSSLIALDITTGKPLWQRELVHRDIWHLDLAAQPTLIELEPNGVPTPSVVQATKTGALFVFERDTGKPVFPIVEQRVPAGGTQPFPVTPLLVSQHPAESADAWGLTFWDRAMCRRSFRRYRNEGPFTPPDTRGTIQWPGNVGGIGWGGVAFDAHRSLLIAAVNHLPVVLAPDGTTKPLISMFGFPCTEPPWGTLVGIDLRSNELVWQVPLGSTEGLGPWFTPARNFGTPHLGGPLASAGDLVFIGATLDSYFRAFDLETGRELWKHRLPAGGQATPMTYRAGRDHRQFVVIAAGGDGTLGTPRGDYVLAFALPK